MINDKFRDECGIMGAYLKSKENNCSSYIYYGLYALQHRGQESAVFQLTKTGKFRPIRRPAW